MRRLALFLVLASIPATAAADVLPEPERPTDWNDHAPPPPPPPPEKELTLLLWSVAVAVAGFGVWSLGGRLRESPR